MSTKLSFAERASSPLPPSSPAPPSTPARSASVEPAIDNSRHILEERIAEPEAATSASSSSFPQSSDSGDDAVIDFDGARDIPPPTSSNVEMTSFDDDDKPSTIDDGLRPSNINWGDPRIKSSVRDRPLRITAEKTVARVEYLKDLPPFFPVPEVSTGYVCKLDDPKYLIRDHEGHLVCLGALVRNADNDSWTGGSGNGDSTTMVTFEEGAEPVECYRARLRCQGGFACSFIDSAKFREARRQDGSTLEGRVAQFITHVRSKCCAAIDSKGEKCTGSPIIREHSNFPL
ncbi:hypothetical protein GGX14DRAFT_574695 [Mycena pura]|uniref:Uncharacterized protein n=1 Tax=Mycena pura TaxID=153505 RepID=A0AAD6V3N5_9AGAR|nr:hypothetical protein GGX14DRAFT_574695 [Mycena pura]